MIFFNNETSDALYYETSEVTKTDLQTWMILTAYDHSYLDEDLGELINLAKQKSWSDDKLAPFYAIMNEWEAVDRTVINTLTILENQAICQNDCS